MINRHGYPVSGRELPAAPGTYALVMHSTATHCLAIGRLGTLTTAGGYYVYIGSARGPGGIRARVHHHLGIAQRPHWHIDYLRPLLEIEQVWYRTGRKTREHRWAGRLIEAGCEIPLDGFGASDCGCRSHLLFAITPPASGLIREDGLRACRVPSGPPGGALSPLLREAVT